MIRLVPWLLVFILGLAPAASAAPSGPTFQGDPQAVAEVQAAYQKFDAARTWRAKMTSPGVAGSQTFEFVAPDRFRVIIGQGAATTELFIIGNEAWIRSGNVCRKQSSMMRVDNPREAMRTGTDATIAVTRGGAETVEGVATQVYRGNAHGSAAATRNPVGPEFAQITINNPPC